MLIPCICEKLETVEYCEGLIVYHPQDITKAERYAIQEGYPEWVLGYKICFACKIHCAY